VVTGVRTTRDGTTVRVLVDTRRRGVSADLADARLTMERIANEPGVEVLAVEVRRAAAQRALVESPVVAGLSVASLTSNQAAPARVAVIGRADTLANEHLTCRFLGDGTLEVEHRETGVRYTGLHRLVDDGDAGDEYNYSPVPVERGIADPLRWLRPPRVQESGPLRASMAARFEYRVPAAIAPDRQSRSVRDVPLDVALEVTLERGATRLDFAMQVVNTALDHRLRLHFPIPFTVTHSNADTAYHVTRRPVLAPRHTEGAPEWELPTHPMRSFVDLSDERTGIALITQGLHEYEVITGPPPALALTLLRSVGWLSRQDLRYRRTTPNYSFITPNLCHDGHDAPCVTGAPGGLVSANKWLKARIPMILHSPAFKHRGLLIVTFDEAQSTGSEADSTAYCNEQPGPNTSSPGFLTPGPGGGPRPRARGGSRSRSPVARIR